MSPWVMWLLWSSCLGNLLRKSLVLNCPLDRGVYASMKGKAVCRTHGGLSTGCKTEAGRQRCAEAKTIHGRETREARTERSLDSASLAVLEAVGFSIGLMSGGRTRGRRSDRMAEVYSEPQALLELRPYSSGVVKQRFK